MKIHCSSIYCHLSSMMRLSEYNGEDIIVTLPMGHTWYDFDYFGIWCRQARSSFGHVNVPMSAFLPPHIEDTVSCDWVFSRVGWENGWGNR